MRFSTGVAAIGLMLAACSSSDSNAPGNAAPLTQADAQVISDEMQAEVAAFNSGGSIPDLMSCRFGFFPGATRLFPGPMHFGDPPAGCPTLDPPIPGDADSDGIPDILTLSFNPATCTFTRPGGEVTMELSGSVTISDPSPTPPANGLHLQFAGLQQKVTLPSSDYFLRNVNGDWQLTSDATGFQADEQTTVAHESSFHPGSVLEKTWTVVFTVQAPATFSPHQPLPSGDFVINGSTNRTRDGVLRSFQIVTLPAPNPPLHRDASCTADNKIVSGTLRITTTNVSGTQTVEITFNGCGVDPTVTLVT